jgi:hypothetical protein
MSVLTRGTTSSDVRLFLGEAGDMLWDASAGTVVWPGQNRYPLLSLARPRQVAERGPHGGRLISLAQACELADQIALDAERRRQEVRERDALCWADLEDET